MVLSIKLSDGTPDDNVLLIANIPYSPLVFHGLIKVHDQLDGIYYKQ
jgi:hypothetical protein